jgi:hypothetical protein
VCFSLILTTGVNSTVIKLSTICSSVAGVGETTNFLEHEECREGMRNDMCYPCFLNLPQWRSTFSFRNLNYIPVLKFQLPYFGAEKERMYIQSEERVLVLVRPETEYVLCYMLS